MKELAAALIVAFVSLAGCKKSAVATDSLIDLHHCLQSGNSVSLCFDSVVSDSRCPANAECVWAGSAICAFTLSKDNQQRSFRLATNALMPGYRQDTVLLGCTIHFSDLLPYPGTGPAPVQAKLTLTQ